MTKGANTIAQQVKSAQDADKVHEWPDEAGECTGEYWAMYVKNQCFRAYDDWNDADLVELARVSALQADAVEQHQKLRDEGYIVYGGKTGLTKIENPRGRVLNTLNSTISSSLRRLGITASNSGDRETKSKRGQQQRQSQNNQPEPKGGKFDRSSLM